MLPQAPTVPAETNIPLSLCRARSLLCLPLMSYRFNESLVKSINHLPTHQLARRIPDMLLRLVRISVHAIINTRCRLILHKFRMKSLHCNFSSATCCHLEHVQSVLYALFIYLRDTHTTSFLPRHISFGHLALPTFHHLDSITGFCGGSHVLYHQLSRFSFVACRNTIQSGLQQILCGV